MQNTTVNQKLVVEINFHIYKQKNKQGDSTGELHLSFNIPFNPSFSEKYDDNHRYKYSDYYRQFDSLVNDVNLNQLVEAFTAFVSNYLVMKCLEMLQVPTIFNHTILVVDSCDLPPITI
jgi:hypothetical protein